WWPKEGLLARGDWGRDVRRESRRGQYNRCCPYPTYSPPFSILVPKSSTARSFVEGNTKRVQRARRERAPDRGGWAREWESTGKRQWESTDGEERERAAPVRVGAGSCGVGGVARHCWPRQAMLF